MTAGGARRPPYICLSRRVLSLPVSRLLFRAAPLARLASRARATRRRHRARPPYGHPPAAPGRLENQQGCGSRPRAATSSRAPVFALAPLSFSLSLFSLPRLPKLPLLPPPAPAPTHSGNEPNCSGQSK
eukprot:356593-Chlamydomonas_euryale.AAC.2